MRRVLHLAIPIALLAFSAVALGSNAKPSRTSDFRCRGAIATLVGTAGNDRLVGTRHDDVIVARAGNDVVRALGGDDKVCDNDGTDHVILGAGEDEAGGGNGSDHIDGGSGDDWLAGRNGNDVITGGAGADRLIGELGNDTLRGNSGPDNIGGGPGTDDCLGGPGRDRIRTCEKGETHETPRDRPPVAADDTDSTSEVSAKDLTVLANDSDADGDPLRIASVDTTGTTGAVSITGGGTGVRYDPGNNFSSLAPGESATDHFTYTLTGGTAPATVNMTIAGIDTAPSAVGDGRTVAEDDPPQMIDVLANDTDPDAGAAGSVQSVTQPTNGTVTITGGGSAVTYEPEPDYCNSPSLGTTDNFTYKLTPGGSTGSVHVTVTCSTDAPRVFMSSSELAYIEGTGAQPVDDSFTTFDIDSANLSGATVGITNNFNGGEDVLAWVDNDPGDNITLDASSTPQMIVLTGDDNLPNYDLALRAVTYENTSDTPSTLTRTVTAQVTDTSAAASTTPTRDITVTPTNDAPVLTTTAGDTAATEDAAAVTVDGGLTLTDPDDTNIENARVRVSSGFQSGDDLVFVDQNGISGAYNTGTGVLTLTGSASKANYQTALRSIKFGTTNNNPNTSKTVEFKVSDGSADSNSPTKGLAVTGVNDAPTLTTTVADLAYGEQSGPAMVDAGITATDPDSNIVGATVQVTAGFVSAEDELAFTDQLGISGSYNDTTGTLTLSGTTTVANYQAALRTVTYENNSDDPTVTRTVSFQITDAGAAPSNVAMRDITFVPSNDAPVVTTSGGSTAYTEGDPPTTIDGALTVADPDDTNIESAQVRISAGFQSGDDLVFVNQNGISGVYNTGTGVLTMTGSASKANYQTALRSINYRHTGDNPVGPKTIEFKANDGDADGNPATKNIAVTGVNDGPTVDTSGTLAYTENDGPVAAASGLNLTDPDSTQIQGATVSVTSNFASTEDSLDFADQNGITGSYSSGTGVLTLSGTTTVANYQTALRSVTYEDGSDNPSTATRTLSFQATDAEGDASNVDTRDISVAATNDAPMVSTTGGNTSYTEGGSATTIDGGVTVTDPDDTNFGSAQVRVSSGFQVGDDLVFVNQNGISGVYNTGTGVLTMTGSATKANYQTAFRSIQYQHTGDNPFSSKTIEFKANDGSVDSNLATKNIAISGANDAPVMDTSGTLAYSEGDGPVAAASGLNLTDADSTQIQGATAQITGNFVSAEDELAFTNQLGISGSYNDTTGTLTLSGTTTVANYQTALRSVTYENSSDTPSTSTRTASFQATDAEGAPSNIDTRDISVAATNDAPVVTTTLGDTAYSEGDPATTIDGGVTVTDPEDTDLESGQVRVSAGFQAGDDLVFVNQNGISGVYNTGTGVLTLTGTSSVANYETALQSVGFATTNGNPSASKTVEFTVNDGDVDSNAATKDLDITATNSPPDVTATAANLTYTENDPATAVDSGLSVTEPEGDGISSASASITSNYQSPEDKLTWADNNGSDNIDLDGASDDQTIALTGADSAANYQAALRAVKYANSSETPSAATRSVTFAATDALAATGDDIRDITVAPADDPPVAVEDSDTVLEDAAATSIPVFTNDTDIDGGPMTLSSATDPANGTVVLTGGSPGAHTGLTYQPDPNYCNDAPLASEDTFDYTLTGGSSATVSMTVTCVNDNPVADDETFNGANSAVGNTTFVGNDSDDGAPGTPDPTDTSPVSDRPHKTISGDILAGDTDVDGPGPLTVTPGSFATNDGGSVTIEADGDFTFEPKASTSCTDSSDFFDYTIEDSGSPEQTDVGRVTIAIAGCARYVNNDDAEGNDGTSEKPFDTLAQAESASAAGDSIFVYDGDDTNSGYSAGIDLKANQKLIGEAAALIVSGDTLHAADGANRPSLTDNNADVVALDDNNEVRGLELDPEGTGSGIAGAAGDTGGGTIDDVRIIDTGTGGTNPGLELDSTTGTFNVSDLTVDNSTASGTTSASKGVRLNGAGTVNFASAGTISISTAGAAGLDSDTTNMGAGSVFDDITVTGSGSGGVRLFNTTGTTTLGNGAGNDLSLTTTSGGAAALLLSSAGTVSVPGAGTANISATGGPAVDTSGTPGVSLALDDVDSTNSATAGISLSGLGTGTFSANSGDIGGATGTAFSVSGGSGAITYPGTLNNGAGQSASITNRTGGAVSLSGAINDTSDAGGGITVSSNTGGSTTFSNGTKTINTTGGPANNNAVVMSASDGHTLNLNGGGLDIDTTTGRGLQADTSGTIQVTGSGNTIDSTTGRALEIANTDIAPAGGGGGITLQRIGSNGATTGVVLNNTGTGPVTVTGSGGTCTSAGTCTGGAIQNSTGSGMSLTSVGGGASFTRVQVSGSGDDGINGASVSGFALDNSRVAGNGNSSSDSGVEMTQLSGTVSFDTTTVTSNATNNVSIANTSGNVNATFNGGTYSETNAFPTSGGDAILLRNDQTGTMTATIQNA
ncbi:MAG TPA: Ig-like domain-containing protein, partial [Thermoleophilaceae bacterium]|nr:Ig-like domain-containing protein [Thermoleophilaceae bacterium]